MANNAIDRWQVTHKGITFDAWTERDDAAEAPWENGDDGRGVVTDWLDVHDQDDADDYRDPAKFRALGHDGNRTRYFDVTATREKARAEGWGVQDPPPGATAEQIIDLAVEAEFKFLDGWCRDDWEYVGVGVRLPETGCESSLWGIESCATDFIRGEVVTELCEQVIKDAGAPDGIDQRIRTLLVLQDQILKADESADADARTVRGVIQRAYSVIYEQGEEHRDENDDLLAELRSLGWTDGR